MKTYPLFDTDADGNATGNQIGWQTEARKEDVEYVLAQPTDGDDGRSEWRWLRLKDGTLMLICFPQGETYMRVSDASVCDFEWAEVATDA